MGQRALEKSDRPNYLKICKSKLPGITSQSPEWPSLKILQALKSGEGVEKSEPLDITSGTTAGVTAEAWIDRSLYQLLRSTAGCLHSTAVSLETVVLNCCPPPEEFSLRILFASLSLDSLKCQFLCIHRWVFLHVRV